MKWNPLSSLFFFIYLFIGGAASAQDRPNILLCIADDWGWPHAGSYGDTVVKTPTFDRLGKEGILFEQAYVSSPSCTPSRNALLTGQHHWRLGTGANLWSKFPQDLDVFPHMLFGAGYEIGHWRKVWGPGKLEGKWEISHPAGAYYKGGLKEFLAKNPEDKPFCFFLGSSDPHRPYDKGSGKKSGIDPSKIQLFGHFPDAEQIRNDVADYYFEVERFDRECGNALELLEEKGLLENTIVIMTGDHGMPFPRCKSNLYDCGTRVPLAIRWPAGITEADRQIENFVSLVDLAPTILESVGLPLPEDMTGTSLLPVLKNQPKQSPTDRSFVIFGKERHTPAQEYPNMGGYPSRAIRTDGFLLIRNYEPDRWPAGTPNRKKAYRANDLLGDVDSGPTKSYLYDNRDKDEEHRRAYELSFGKRPEFELYDVEKDPDQLNNVAGKSEYASTLEKLKVQLEEALKATGDPRATGEFQNWDEHLTVVPSWHKKRDGKKQDQ